MARREKAISAPIQAVVVREVDKDGKVVDPDAVKPAEGPTGDTVVDTGRKKIEEKDGVFVVVGGKTVAFRAVETGIMGDTDVEIVGGLQEGEEIVSGSYKTLRTLKADARIKVEDKSKKKS